MNGLSLNFDGETRVFGPDGKVSVLENGQAVPKARGEARLSPLTQKITRSATTSMARTSRQSP